MLKLDNFLQAILICHIVLLQISQSMCQTEPRIVGGKPSSIVNAKFLVQLFVDNNFWCGGTLVARRYVVTAAHCVYNIQVARLMVKAGASTLYEKGVQSRVSRVMVNGNFNPKTLHMDVAVLRLARPLEGPLIKPVPLCTRGWKHNDPVQLFGWGKRHEAGQINPNRIQTVNLRVVGRYRCRNMYGFLTRSMFCATLPGKSTCYGDSGGPVMVNGEYCGIVSWGKGCARPGFPDVYTNILVDDVNKFIRSCMRS